MFFFIFTKRPVALSMFQLSHLIEKCKRGIQHYYVKGNIQKQSKLEIKGL
jgi:hypothetical protein